MSDTLAAGKAHIVLEHPEDVLVDVLLQVPLGEPWVGKQEDRLRDLPQSRQSLLAANILGGVKSVAQAIEEFRGHALRRQCLAQAGRNAHEQAAELAQVREGGQRQDPLLFSSSISADGLPNFGGTIRVLEAQGPVLARLCIFPDDYRLPLALAFQLVHTAVEHRSVVQECTDLLFVEDQAPCVAASDDGDEAGACVLPLALGAERIQPSTMLAFHCSLLDIHV
mmetsp:Transcript_123321/g.356379  ORF Transcript_123321/g.356379 Transcript_123321/m.356379 type:complete len:224 (-) Transcript_123321:77-748(-)